MKKLPSEYFNNLGLPTVSVSYHAMLRANERFGMKMSEFKKLVKKSMKQHSKMKLEKGNDKDTYKVRVPQGYTFVVKLEQRKQDDGSLRHVLSILTTYYTNKKDLYEGK